MNSDLVFQEKPQTLNSYQDLIDRKKITLYFVDGISDITQFSEEVDETTIQYRLFKK